MKKKRKMRKALAKAICWMLSVSMVAPNITPIVSFAAETIENLPRQVDFSEPESLTLEELGIRTDSNADAAEEDDRGTETATSSDAGSGSTTEGSTTDGSTTDSTTETVPPYTMGNYEEEIEVREPEVFYEEVVDEPVGKLVQFKGNLRTYELEEGKYLSIMGGYSGLYEDEDGVIRRADNTLVPVSGAEENDSDATASDSNAVSTYSLRRRTAAAYTNEAGAMDVRLPEQMTESKGITIEHEGYEMELVPVSGDYSMSLVDGNAIRYSNVYENVDVQYTLVGESVKEDIILLDRDTRTTFSYHLDTDGLKVKRTQDSVLLYDESAKEPVFTLTAPVMQDAAGEISTDISMKAEKQDDGYRITVEADEDWLEDEDRAFPVRIDPSINSGPAGFHVVSVSSANPGTNYLWTKPAYIGYDDDSRTGNNLGYGNTRAYFALGSTDDGWDQVPRDVVIDRATFSVGQQSDWSGGTSKFVLLAPDSQWNIGMTWNEQETLSFTRVGEAFQAVGKDEMYHLDVTEIMKEWLAGTRTQCGLCIGAEVEPPSAEAALEFHHPCELLYNQDSAAYGPRLEWVWGGTLPTELELIEVEDLEVYVNPVVTPGNLAGSRTTEGVLAYGLSQIESEVTYTLMVWISTRSWRTTICRTS